MSMGLATQPQNAAAASSPLLSRFNSQDPTRTASPSTSQAPSRAASLQASEATACTHQGPAGMLESFPAATTQFAGNSAIIMRSPAAIRDAPADEHEHQAAFLSEIGIQPPTGKQAGMQQEKPGALSQAIAAAPHGADTGRAAGPKSNPPQHGLTPAPGGGLQLAHPAGHDALDAGAAELAELEQLLQESLADDQAAAAAAAMTAIAAIPTASAMSLIPADAATVPFPSDEQPIAQHDDPQARAQLALKHGETPSLQHGHGMRQADPQASDSSSSRQAQSCLGIRLGAMQTSRDGSALLGRGSTGSACHQGPTGRVALTVDAMPLQHALAAEKTLHGSTRPQPTEPQSQQGRAGMGLADAQAGQPQHASAPEHNNSLDDAALLGPGSQQGDPDDGTSGTHAAYSSISKATSDHLAADALPRMSSNHSASSTPSSHHACAGDGPSAKQLDPAGNPAALTEPAEDFCQGLHATHCGHECSSGPSASPSDASNPCPSNQIIFEDGCANGACESEPNASLKPSANLADAQEPASSSEAAAPDAPHIAAPSHGSQSRQSTSSQPTLYRAQNGPDSASQTAAAEVSPFPAAGPFTTSVDEDLCSVVPEAAGAWSSPISQPGLLTESTPLGFVDEEVCSVADLEGGWGDSGTASEAGVISYLHSSLEAHDLQALLSAYSPILSPDGLQPGQFMQDAAGELKRLASAGPLGDHHLVPAAKASQSDSPHSDPDSIILHADAQLSSEAARVSNPALNEASMEVPVQPETAAQGSMPGGSAGASNDANAAPSAKPERVHGHPEHADGGSGLPEVSQDDRRSGPGDKRPTSAQQHTPRAPADVAPDISKVPGSVQQEDEPSVQVGTVL